MAVSFYHYQPCRPWGQAPSLTFDTSGLHLGSPAPSSSFLRTCMCSLSPWTLLKQIMKDDSGLVGWWAFQVLWLKPEGAKPGREKEPWRMDKWSGKKRAWNQPRMSGHESTARSLHLLSQSMVPPGTHSACSLLVKHSIVFASRTGSTPQLHHLPGHACPWADPCLLDHWKMGMFLSHRVKNIQAFKYG